MSRDLEETLSEMGPEYRAVVARLKGEGRREKGERRWLVAASLFLMIGLGVFFQTSKPQNLKTSPRGPHEYQMGIPEMIATQNPDGSWKNDFLTRRNAAALKVCGDPVAQIAYRKAVRNLRLRGIL